MPLHRDLRNQHSEHSSRFPGVSKASLIDIPQAAIRFVEDRVAGGADYIKVVADVPGQSQEVASGRSGHRSYR
jgi:hypothetical protein